MDSHNFGKSDPDQSEKLDPDPHQRQNSGAKEAQKAALGGRRHSQWRR
jgi:hypothetical protein